MRMDCTNLTMQNVACCSNSSVSIAASSPRWRGHYEQEAQLMLTNPREAYRGQSRSPIHSMLGIVSSCAIVTLSLIRAVLSDIRLQKCDLEIRVTGHSRLLKVVPVDRLRPISVLSLRLQKYWDIRLQKCRDLDNWVTIPSMSLEMSMRCSAYDFLLTFYSNMALSRAASEIFNVENVMTLKSVSEITQGHWKWCHSIDCVWFPISVLK